MITIRMGGVPEHFNYVWHLPQFAQALSEHGIAIDWVDYPGGTGAMCKDLRAERLDLALLLTEGAVADIANGNPSRIVGTWVDSPLTWGIHAKGERAADSIPRLDQATYAISRYGSGSHLMAIINCQLRGHELPTRFEVVGNLDGAREALLTGRADLFLWEKFTTKFLVDRGDFQRVDVCDTPWPCFAFVARESFLTTHEQSVWQLLTILQATLSRHPVGQVAGFIAERYQLLPEDVHSWSQRVSWSSQPQVSRAALKLAIDGLLAAAVIDQRPSLDALLADFVEVET